jgi:SAM-dependent methyltransferase
LVFRSDIEVFSSGQGIEGVLCVAGASAEVCSYYSQVSTALSSGGRFALTSATKSSMGVLAVLAGSAEDGFTLGKDGMPESFSSKLQIWEGWLGAPVRGNLPVSLGEPVPPGGRLLADNPDRLFDEETLHADRRGRERPEPFTLQWYREIEEGRHSRHGSWIPRLLEFTKHTGDSLLALGEGLGTDWVQYARHGARVTVCSRSLEQLAVVQRNFDLRGLQASFLHADLAVLPVETASIDVVCLSGLLGEMPEPARLIEEIYRVLKPGGKVLAVARARYDVRFWRRVLLPWERWLSRPKTGEGEAAFSARGLRRLFGRFVEQRVYKRHLRRRELPHLWRWLPHPLLQRMFGKRLLFKGFKPLSAAMSLHAAA